MTITPSSTPIMVLGTTSGAGKSLLATALCRCLQKRHVLPYPFKGQNMSNNAWVDKTGGEMAYSQALQAWGAGVEPVCLMNPILLKPIGGYKSEVIHLGKSVGLVNAENYYQEWFRPGWEAIRTALKKIYAENQNYKLILEGAGSPVEVNLQYRDLTNLRLAQYVGAKCILVADIERGGVFAQIVGTLSLLRPVERKLIKGIIINKFRGRRELFDEGRNWIETHTGIPVLGVMPWINENFPPEDSLDLINRSKSLISAEIRIGVIRLASISNFSDLDPLEAEESVKLEWIMPNSDLKDLDALIIPGSKQTIDDLKILKESKLDQKIIEYANKNGTIFGICGGMQMLGSALVDPHDMENSKSRHINEIKGLDLLPICTEFSKNKLVKQSMYSILWPIKMDVLGFEIHHGITYLLDDYNDSVKPIFDDKRLGWFVQTSSNSSIAGSYLHGIFDNGAWRRHWLNQIRSKKRLEKLEIVNYHFSNQRDILLDILSDSFLEFVKIDNLLTHD